MVTKVLDFDVSNLCFRPVHPGFDVQFVEGMRTLEEPVSKTTVLESLVNEWGSFYGFNDDLQGLRRSSDLYISVPLFNLSIGLCYRRPCISYLKVCTAVPVRQRFTDS